MGLNAIEYYDVISSLCNYSPNNANTSVQPRLFSTLQEMNE